MIRLVRGLFGSIPTLVAAIIYVMFLASAQSSTAAVHEEREAPFQFVPLVFTENAPAPLCPFGVNATGGVSGYPLDTLRAGWYMNFGVSTNPTRPHSIEYKPVIRLCPTGIAEGSQLHRCYPDTISDTDVEQLVLSMLGSDWFIGNEPDRPDHRLTGQDAVDPALYAQRYHALYGLIKATDPTARLFAGSIVQPTEVRLKYLDLVLQAYRQQVGTRMPVDGWSIHNYILNEKSCQHYGPGECWGADIPPGVDAKDGLVIDVQQHDDFALFKAQIERFRHWMAENGYRNTPLYLSEFGVLMPQGVFNPDFNTSRVNTFMTETFDYLRNTTDAATGYPADGNRLVQQFSWYSTSDINFNGRLFDPETQQPTAIGNHFANYTAEIAEEADYFPVRFYAAPALYTGTPTTVTLTAIIANSGNTATAHPVVVRFYDGDPAAGGVQIGEDQIVNLSGCGDTRTVQTAWPDLAVGTYRAYMRVEPAGSSVPETNGDNNVVSSAVLVSTEQLFAPLVNRH